MAERRAYRMGARAASAADTRGRVLDAALECFARDDYDNVSLKAIARQAGVGLQTVVRAAGSKEGLFVTVADRFFQRAAADFEIAAGADWEAAVDALLRFHELYGDQTMRIMAHEHRVPAVGDQVRRSRELQAAWILVNHADAFEGDDTATRQERLAAILAITGGRFWYTLRRDHGLSVEATRRVMLRQLQALLQR